MPDLPAQATIRADGSPAAVPARPDPRVQEILDSVKSVFAAKGFDGASMQDLARAAGMSAGNFYRYFASKDAIIAAMVERELALVQAEFERVMQSPDPRAALLAVLRWRITSVTEGDGSLWAEIAAAASRSAEIGGLHARMETGIGGYLIAVFARIAGLPEAEAAARFSAHAGLLMMLVHGFVTHDCGNTRRDGPAEEARLGELVLRTAEWLLSEIAPPPDAARPPLVRV